MKLCPETGILGSGSGLVGGKMLILVLHMLF